MKILSVLLFALLTAAGCTGGGGGSDSSSPADTGANIGDGRGPQDNQNDGDQTTADPVCVEKIGLNKLGPEQEVIIHDNTWYPSSQIKNQMMKTNAKATVYVRMSASRCTGFLVSEDVIMTNNHCIGNASQAQGVYVRFDWLSNNGSYKQYTCDEFIGTNRALDYTLVRCKGSPGKNHPQVILADYQGKTGYPIYLPHQNCDYYANPSCSPTQKLSEGKLTGYSSTQVEHDADTLGGSSGSPIFDNESHKVVAIHNAGMNTAGGGGVNFGIQMYKIIEHIENNYPSVDINVSASRQPAWDVCD